jgi:hypothetical protein
MLYYLLGMQFFFVADLSDFLFKARLRSSSVFNLSGGTGIEKCLDVISFTPFV